MFSRTEIAIGTTHDDCGQRPRHAKASGRRSRWCGRDASVERLRRRGFLEFAVPVAPSVLKTLSARPSTVKSLVDRFRQADCAHAKSGQASGFTVMIDAKATRNSNRRGTAFHRPRSRPTATASKRRWTPRVSGARAIRAVSSTRATCSRPSLRRHLGVSR